MGVHFEEEIIKEGNRTYYLVNNKYYTLYKLSSIYNIPYSTLYGRVVISKMPYMIAIKSEVQERNREYDGKTIQEMSSELGMTYTSFYNYAYTRKLGIIEAYKMLSGGEI